MVDTTPFQNEAWAAAGPGASVAVQPSGKDTGNGEKMSDLKRALLSVHPWYEVMSRPMGPWQTMRAILNGFDDNELKVNYLPKGHYEPPKHYAMRIELSKFLGKVPTIAQSMAGAVFAQQPDIQFAEIEPPEPPEPFQPSDDAEDAPTTAKDAPAPEDKDEDAEDQSNAPSDATPPTSSPQPQEPPKPKEPALTREQEALQEWAGNVDRHGRTLIESLEANSSESIAMGMSVFLVDGPRMPAKEVIQASLAKDAPTTESDMAALGVKTIPRLVPFCIEQLTNWGVDDQGTPVWAIIAHEVSMQPDPLLEREAYVEWIVVTTTEITTYRAKLLTDLTYPITEQMVDEPEVHVAATAHGLNKLPVVPLYGGGRVFAPFQVRSLLEGAARADIAGFNEDSWATFARCVHLNPLLKIKSRKDLTDVWRSASQAFKLDPVEQEDVEYASTDSAGFQLAMDAVERRGMDAYRQAGADPTGMFENGSASPESGTAKNARFSHTESRALARISSHAADAAYDILEVASRVMEPGTKPPAEDQLFTGSVRFPSTFDGADSGAITETYIASKDTIKSVTYHRIMHTRLALLNVGEISQDDQKQIAAEIAASDVMPPPPTPMVVDQAGNPVGGGDQKKPPQFGGGGGNPFKKKAARAQLPRSEALNDRMGRGHAQYRRNPLGGRRGRLGGRHS